MSELVKHLICESDWYESLTDENFHTEAQKLLELGYKKGEPITSHYSEPTPLEVRVDSSVSAIDASQQSN